MTAPDPSGPAVNELRFALAEADSHQPPLSLRTRVLSSAVSARAPGVAVGTGSPISPVEAYRRTMLSMDAVLAALSDAEWRRHVLRDLDIQGLIGHLIGVERQLHAALAIGAVDGPGRPDLTASSDHVASTQAEALAQRGRPPDETRAEWMALMAATVAHVAGLDRAGRERPVSLHTFTIPVERMLVVRSFETWTHEEDIRRATGRPLQAPDPARLRLMTELAVSALPAGLDRIGRPQPGRTARIVLTGPGGGTWQASLDRGTPGETDVRIIADAVVFCRHVASRVEPGGLGADITGDHALGAVLLDGARALALD